MMRIAVTKKSGQRRWIRGSVSLVLLVVVWVVLFLGFYWIFFRTSCDRTLSYSVGLFDERFGLTREEFLGAVREAEGVWEEGTGFNLFEHNPEASFIINLVFDERQAEAIALQETEQNLTVSSGNIASLQKEYEELSNSYEGRLAAYEEQIHYWNSGGGAPPEEFRKLQEERRKLESIRLRGNSLARRINSYVDSHNITVEAYNSRVGGNFTQGDYTGNAITIYQFSGREELVLVLVHELGHALGLDHVEENSAAVMYRLMGNQDVNDIQLTPVDKAALNAVCKKESL